MNSAHDCRYRQALHDLLDADIRKYLERGGEIERVDTCRQEKTFQSQAERNAATFEDRRHDR
jgi:hypothetical protein